MWSTGGEIVEKSNRHLDLFRESYLKIRITAREKWRGRKLLGELPRWALACSEGQGRQCPDKSAGCPDQASTASSMNAPKNAERDRCPNYPKIGAQIK